MELAELRFVALTAVVSDDWLMERLVLKGGCALELVHRIGGRSSLDIDFSIADDFKNLEEVRSRLEGTLARRFAAKGYSVFDFRFGEKPEGSADRRWGGYVAEFKVIEMAKHQSLKGDIDAARRNAVIAGPKQQRIFRIEVSKHEYCGDKQLMTVNDYDLYVYSLAMIAAEKVRAICQQSPGYLLRKHPAPRPRDFYDIHTIVRHGNLDLPAHVDLVRAMFAAKEVPLSLIASIDESRSFHEAAWPSVRDSVAGTIHDFDFYFDFVVASTQKLKSLWDV